MSALRRAFGRLTLDPGNKSRGDKFGMGAGPSQKHKLSFRDLFPESSAAPDKPYGRAIMLATSVTSPHRGKGGSSSGARILSKTLPRATLLPLREKVDRPQGETDEGCPAPAPSAEVVLTLLPSSPGGRLRAVLSANSASGTIGGEKAMRAVLEWRPEGSDEGGAALASFTGVRDVC